jgi:hypothetical protein
MKNDSANLIWNMFSAKNTPAGGSKANGKEPKSGLAKVSTLS